MDENIQNKILKALFFALKPLARTLVRVGIGHREFSDVAKAAFVHEALSGYGVRGRETNMSRVAIMTGISRKEVKKIRDSDFEQILLSSLSGPASEILSRWHNDPCFNSESNKPRGLEYESGENSFSDLVKLYAGDIPVGAMKTELMRMGAVEERRGLLYATQRNYMPADIDEKIALGLESIVTPCLETLDNNCDPERIGPLFWQTSISVNAISSEYLPAVRKVLRKKLGEFGNDADDFLTEFTASKPSEMEDVSEAGILLIYFERPHGESDD